MGLSSALEVEVILFLLPPFITCIPFDFRWGQSNRRIDFALVDWLFETGIGLHVAFLLSCWVPEHSSNVTWQMIRRSAFRGHVFSGAGRQVSEAVGRNALSNLKTRAATPCEESPLLIYWVLLSCLDEHPTPESSAWVESPHLQAMTMLSSQFLSCVTT